MTLFRLFLSHKSGYKKETAALKEHLSHFGISAFVAHRDIHPTQDWQDEIENALATMDGFAALLTSDFHDSKWTDQEVGFAFARRVPRLAVMLGGKPYGFMGKFQGLPSTWENAAQDMAGVLVQNDRMFSVFVNKIRNCPNWDSGNRLGTLLNKIISLSSKQVDELVAAYNETAEIRGAFAFNGHKRGIYGPGLISHLKLLDKRPFKFNDDTSAILIP